MLPMPWVARFCGNAQGKEDQLFSELEARYGPAKAPVQAAAQAPRPAKKRAGRACGFEVDSANACSRDGG